jgi:hypothetical protein
MSKTFEINCTLKVRDVDSKERAVDTLTAFIRDNADCYEISSLHILDVEDVTEEEI